MHAAEVVIVDNSLRKTFLKRPMQKLHPPEINVLDENATNAKAARQGTGWNIQMVKDEDIAAITVP